MLIAKRFFQPGFMVLPLCVSLHALADPTPNSAPPVDEHLVEQVSAFLEHFIDPLKTPAQQAALFTNDAEYYGYGKVGNAAIIQDIRYFSRRWPERDYRLGAIHYITPDPASNRVFVSYEIAYRVANQSRTTSGKAHYGAVLVNLDSAPKVEWIKENFAK